MVTLLIKGKEVFIDDEDEQLVQSYAPWFISEQGYARISTRSRKGQPTLMHRIILGVKGGENVDHIDQNRLNNQKSNLRRATHSQNKVNSGPLGGTSKYKGVYFRRGKWEANIKKNSEGIYLGAFLLEEDAARAYDKAAKAHFGEFAYLNFPEVSNG